VKDEHREAYDILVKSFAPIAVFDRDYDALGPYPDPPRLPPGEIARRTLIVYNDAFRDEQVEVTWSADLDGERLAGETRTLQIPLGAHSLAEIAFMPTERGELHLHLASAKGGSEQFRDRRTFVVE
jgi:hypothetical protein